MRLIVLFTLLFYLGFPIPGFSMSLGGVDIHGFLSQGYLQSNEHNFWSAETAAGTFEYNEFGINFSTDLTDRLRVGMQFLARDLGATGNDDVELDWAFLDYQYRNYFGVRAGKIKSPYGFYSQTRDVDALRTSILLPTSVYNEMLRESANSIKGVGVYGLLPVGVEYDFQAGIINIPASGGTAQLLEGIYGLNIDKIKSKTTYNARLIWNTGLDGFRVGASVLNYDFNAAEPSGATYQFEGAFYIGSVEYLRGDLNLNAEYMTGPNTIHRGGIRLNDVDREHYFVRASYRFTDYLELGAYYSMAQMDKNRRTPANKLQDIALSTRFDINEYWIFKLEAHAMDGLFGVTEPTSTDEGWYLFAAKLSVMF